MANADCSGKVAKRWQYCQNVAALTKARLPKGGNVARVGGSVLRYAFLEHQGQQ